MSNPKPNWWPQNPYPEDIFVMKRDRYPEIVPDDMTRTALSGCLGREFWEIASNMIWTALQNHREDMEDTIAALQADLDEAAGLLEQTNNYAEGAGCDYCGWTGCYFCGPRMKWLVAIAAFLAKKEAK